MARVPSTYVPLGEAVIKAACVWFAEEIRADGFTPNEIAILFRWKFARAKVAARPSTAEARDGVRWKGIPVDITPEDRQAATETPEIKALRSKVNRIDNVPQEAYGRLRDLLSTAHLISFIIHEHSGRPYKIEPHLWNTEDADTAHERGLMRFVRGQGWIVGPAVISRGDLDDILAGRAAQIGPKEDPPPILSSRMTEPDPRVANIEAKAEKQRRTSVRQQQALKALNELYPNGLPDPVELPNQELIRAVGKKMGDRTPSDDTILRAAGRRK